LLCEHSLDAQSIQRTAKYFIQTGAGAQKTFFGCCKTAKYKFISLQLSAEKVYLIVSFLPRFAVFQIYYNLFREKDMKLFLLGFETLANVVAA